MNSGKEDHSQKQPDQVTTVTISDIVIINVSPAASPKKKKQKKSAATSTEVNEEDSFHVIYQVTLSCKNPNRFRVRSDRDTWLSEDPSTYMRDKVREAIKAKADSFNLSFDNDIGRYFMENDGPWEYLWAKTENDMHKIKEESRQKSLEVKAGHASRTEKIDRAPK